MFIILFLLIGAFFIISEENIKLDSQENVGHFFDLYGHWVDKIASNSQGIAGYVFKMEWLPGGG